jgi:glucose-1-phosphate adenylyltransferase
VFGADHIYRMDIRQMVDFHLSRKAQITVAALPVPLASASAFGVIEANDEDRIVGFEEKPARPKPMPGDATHAYASMGNYLFEADALIQVLTQDAAHGGTHDFGRNIIPRLINDCRAVAYNFQSNTIPHLQPYEEHGYWRDVGTIEAYWHAHMDLLGEQPRFDLRNAGWPIMSDSQDGPAASLVRSRVDASMIGQGSHIVDSEIIRSLIGRNVRIDPGCRIEESVILDGSIVGAGSSIRRVIADRFNVIPKQSALGGDTIMVLARGRSVGGRAVNVSPG